IPTHSPDGGIIDAMASSPGIGPAPIADLGEAHATFVVHYTVTVVPLHVRLRHGDERARALLGRWRRADTGSRYYDLYRPERPVRAPSATGVAGATDRRADDRR